MFYAPPRVRHGGGFLPSLFANAFYRQTSVVFAGGRDRRACVEMRLAQFCRSPDSLHMSAKSGFRAMISQLGAVSDYTRPIAPGCTLLSLP